MAKYIGSVKINCELCKGCELCIGVCKTKVLSMSKKVNSKGYHYAVLNAEEGCTGCANCGIICPDSIITVYRKAV